MKAIFNFPRTIVNALTSAVFYREAMSDTFGHALGYFLLLGLIISVVRAAATTIIAIPVVNQFTSKVKENVVDLYPAELQIDIKNGVVSTNVKEPYIVPMSVLDKIMPQAKSDINGVPDEENLAVIDTKATVEDFPKYKTFVLLNKTGIVVQDQTSTKYSPFPTDFTTTVDRRTIRQIWSVISPYFKWVVPGITAIIFAGFLISVPLWNLLFLVFGSMLVVIAAKYTKVELKFKEVYKVGLYSITLPLIIENIFKLLMGDFPIPMGYTIIFVVFTVYMLKKSKVDDTPVKVI